MRRVATQRSLTVVHKLRRLRRKLGVYFRMPRGIIHRGDISRDSSLKMYRRASEEAHILVCAL